jgi:hypothetical protein
MQRLLGAAALIVAAVSAPALAADFGVALTIGQPGFYGQIDIGDYPPPRLIYQQPRYIERATVYRAPIYLHVPPGHARNWRRHCRAYGACGEPVYFVQDNWYAREYVPRYQQRYVEHRDDYRDERRHDYRGRQHGKEHGRGHNH